MDQNHRVGQDSPDEPRPALPGSGAVAAANSEHNLFGAGPRGLTGVAGIGRRLQDALHEAHGIAQVEGPAHTRAERRDAFESDDIRARNPLDGRPADSPHRNPIDPLEQDDREFIESMQRIGEQLQTVGVPRIMVNEDGPRADVPQTTANYGQAGSVASGPVGEAMAHTWVHWRQRDGFTLKEKQSGDYAFFPTFVRTNRYGPTTTEIHYRLVREARIRDFKTGQLTFERWFEEV